MTSTPKLTLTYFNIKGRGEPIRLAMAIGKIPFSHKAIAFKDWPDLKPTFPLGMVPILEVGDGDDKEAIAESIAILRYVGKLGGLYPEDPLLALRVDSLMDTNAEMALPIAISVGGPKRLLMEEDSWSDEVKMGMRRRIAESETKGIPFYFGFFEKKLEKNNTGWLVGDSITIADIAFYQNATWITSGILDGIPTTLVDKFPKIVELISKIEAIPEVAAFREAHPLPYTDFDYEP